MRERKERETWDFFEGGLRMDQLDFGKRPIQHLFASIITFNKIKNGLTPNSLKPPLVPQRGIENKEREERERNERKDRERNEMRALRDRQERDRQE